MTHVPGRHRLQGHHLPRPFHRHLALQGHGRQLRILAVIGARILSGIKSLFQTQAPENFASAVERSGVTPAALGSGYVVFFAYSALIGVFALALAFMVERRQLPADRANV